MSQFYLPITRKFTDEPAVCLAFGVRWALDYEYPRSLRHGLVINSMCRLHRVAGLLDIDYIDFLKTLHQKRIAHLLPDELERFKSPELITLGTHGHHYCDLFRYGWFNNPAVAKAFFVKHDQKPSLREKRIKNAIYWELGVVSLTQVAPEDFIGMVLRRKAFETLPCSLKRIGSAL